MFAFSRLIFRALSFAALATLALKAEARADAQTDALIDEASASQAWLRLYQYERETLGGFKSDVTSGPFFFSPHGRVDPKAELLAAIEAFESGGGEYGIQKMPAACVFPARKRVLEYLLGRSFPAVACPELTNWVERLGADEVSLVFVGAYRGNPASILGHTFLRLTNSKRAEKDREGVDLLSNSVGFLAHPDPADNRALYMIKGLTGGYPGFFEIEPHYMKVGLYNNSESRDLWDLKLNFSPAETELLVLHLWEIAFNASFPYFFIDENCSYRLIKLLEAIRPHAVVADRLDTVVLPAETMRAVVNAGWATDEPRFRSSIQRRLRLKLALLEPESLQRFEGAKEAREGVERVSDPTVIDALLDHWLFENYKAKTALPPKRAAIMEATYRRAAAVQETSLFQLSHADIRKHDDLVPPFSGHRPKWIELQGGRASAQGEGEASEKLIGELSLRSGIQPFWSSDPGYREVSAIEYLGASVATTARGDARWKLLLIDVKAIEDALGSERAPSWAFDASAGNSCGLCSSEEGAQPEPLSHVRIAGGAGIGLRSNTFTGYLMAHMRGHLWKSAGADGLLAPGVVAGVKVARSKTSFVLEGANHWFKNQRESALEARLGRALSRDLDLSFRVAAQETKNGTSGAASEQRVTFGIARFFEWAQTLP